ncbi:NlpC/P60 family protein [Rubrolithibacter danxiaensis]|uniref:C40 family peptidase n=1 Tax=Rubrolithibacter danxiaensis TaxID=3390805 RepID=UPI003BF90365
MTSSTYGICNLSIVPVRAEPSDKSEITTQLLFGDCFEIIQKTDKWVEIKTAYEDYTGWIDVKQYVEAEYEEYQKFSKAENVLSLEVYHAVKNISKDSYLYLVAGCSIPVSDQGKFTLNEEEYQVEGTSIKLPESAFKDKVISCSKFFLNAPYLWGGRSVFGIDCSGFTQIVFKLFGVRLKRDAWQQAEQGELISSLENVQAGDLAFFDNDQGRITHVGIVISSTQIIHASGRVKIDSLNPNGIYSEELQRQTHKLRVIKRYV